MTQLTDKIASDSKISHDARALRNGHRGCVVWLTGLSGSGKSTLARALERRLFDEGRHVYVLDGDLVRTGLCSDLTFSMKDRTENIRRVGEVARLMADAGMIAIGAFISPFRADRDRIRAACNKGNFIEVYVNAPLDVCEKRDVKGLYVKARSNVLKEFTGISSPYEAPLSPEVELHTDQMTVQDCVELMVKAIGC